MSSTESIAILVAHGDVSMRDYFVQLLSDVPGLTVIAATADSDTTVATARTLNPDILLIDYELPGRYTPALGQGIETTELVSFALPNTAVILVSQDISPANLRRAIVAGARQFILANAPRDEIVRTIQQVHSSAHREPLPVARSVDSSDVPGIGYIRPNGKAIAVFSPRGGVGCTTIATNLAIALKQESGQQVTLVDGVLPFGDVGVFLDLPSVRSIGDLTGVEGALEQEMVEATLMKHNSGIKVLLAPQRPELADLVTGELLRETIDLLKIQADYVIIDTWSALDERVLTSLETSDKVVLVLSLTLSSIRSAKIFLQVATLLQFPANKIVVIATRIGAPDGLTNADVEDALGHPVDFYVPFDSYGTLRAINEGKPLMVAAREASVSLAIRDLARRLIGDDNRPGVIRATPAVTETQGRLRKIFNRA